MNALQPESRLLMSIGQWHLLYDICPLRLLSPGKSQICHLSSHRSIADVVPSLDKLTSYDAEFNRHIKSLNDLSPAELLHDAEEHQSTLNSFKRWKTDAVKSFLRRMKALVPDDISALVQVIAEQGRDIAIEW